MTKKKGRRKRGRGERARKIRQTGVNGMERNHTRLIEKTPPHLPYKVLSLSPLSPPFIFLSCNAGVCINRHTGWFLPLAALTHPVGPGVVAISSGGGKGSGSGRGNEEREEEYWCLRRGDKRGACHKKTVTLTIKILNPGTNG